MDSKIEQDDITCVVCQTIPSNAYTSSCCGIVVCEECVLSMKQNRLFQCPNCRNKSPNFQQNMYLMKLINKFPTTCKFECGFVSPISEMKNHEKQCHLKTVQCRECAFSGSKKDFLEHATQKHEDQILKLLELNKNPQLSQHIDVLSEIKNSAGNACYIGTTSKFYCGKSAGYKCNICSGICGPSNGCNCVSCMELDIKYRKLQKGALVNGEGRIAFYKNGQFYCGLKTDSRVCGKDNTCRHCTSLMTDFQYYKTLVQ